MWKGPTVAMEGVYPFGVIQGQGQQSKHLVRKKIANSDIQLEKARVQAHLKHDCLIKLQNAQQENGEYYLLFEYVPLSFDKWYATVSREFIENYQQRLILLSRYIADRGIITDFSTDNMGVTETGEAKYFLDPSFVVESSVDKLALKKKYKQQIRHLIQSYIDRKSQPKPSSKPQIPEKKQNAKILKILQAIEKGKANLSESKQTALMLPQQQQVMESKATLKPIKNIQNITFQKQVNKVNKIQVMVNNKPVEVLQQQFKRQYASSSFYVNGMPAVVMERGGEARRLLSPNDKFARFEEVKYKEYKSLKTSGEFYVQDFINVLQADDSDKPGSPKARGIPKLGLIAHTMGPRESFKSPPRMAIEPQPQKNESFKPQTIKPQPQRLSRKLDMKQKQSKQQIEDHFSVKTGVGGQKPRENLFLSGEGIKMSGVGGESANIKNSCELKMGNKANDLQKKVSQAIANSLNAISKFKNAKNQNP